MTNSTRSSIHSVHSRSVYLKLMIFVIASDSINIVTETPILYGILYFSSQSSALDQDCANLKHNLSLSWWKYDKRKRRHCFMWLGFVLFLVVVIVAMSVFISSLTGSSQSYTSKKQIRLS